jgi:hypothetical protein
MEDLYEEIAESLRDWFKKSKSKDGKPGWVQVVSGKPCARQPGQKTTPKCVSSAKRASMSKKERESAQRRKRKADPGQPKKSGAAKPTYVATDKKKKKKKKKSKKNEEISMELEQIILEELEAVLDEKKKRKKKKKKKKAKRDACYHKVKSRYKVWPSAYASGALVKCRKVGAKNWGNSKKEHLEIMIEDELAQILIERKQKRGSKKCWDGYKRNYKVPKGAPGSCIKKGKKNIKEEEEKSDLKSKVIKALRDEGGAAGMDALKKHTKASKKEIDKVVNSADNIRVHEDGDIILMDSLEEKKKKKACKPAKGKRFAKRVNGKCRSFGQSGQGDAYCARSAKIKKCKNPPCANDLSRKKWKCRGSKSMKE